MNAHELRAHNANRKITQLCFVTDNLDQTINAWVENYKVGPWMIVDYNNSTTESMIVDGQTIEEPFEARIASASLGEMEIEIIEPVSGPLIYQSWLDEHGPGLHHIRENVPEREFDKTVQSYRSQGLKLRQRGKSYAYLQALLEPKSYLGFMIEVGNEVDAQAAMDFDGVLPEIKMFPTE